MAAPGLQRFPQLLMVFVLTLFWGSWMALISFFQFLKSPQKFLAAKSFAKIPDRALNPELGEHGFITITTSVGNGSQKLKFHYVSNGSNDKPLMLFLHGFPECWYSWRYQLKEFHKEYRAVAVDMRGYGESDKPSGIKNYCVNFLMEDVKEIVKALGYEKCVLVGHDWGGAIAWSIAAKYPEICDKVIIMNAPHGAAMQKHLRSSWKQFLASWYMFYFQMPILPEIMMKASDFKFLALVFRGKNSGLKNKDNFTPEDLDVFKYYFNSYESRTGPFNWYRSAMRYVSDIPKVKIQPELLIIWGTEDVALTIELAAKSAAYVENVTVEYVPGASHWVQQDDPETVNAHVWKFLNARYAATNYIRANLRYIIDVPKVKVTVPLLLIWGTGDLFLTKQLAEASLTYVQRPILKFVEGASHWVQQDQPEQVNQCMHEFLN